MISYKKITLLLIVCSSMAVFGQDQDCSEFKTGVFQFSGINGGVYTVIRTDSTQFERNSKQSTYSKMKIRWNSDCSYTLYDMKEYRRGKPTGKDEKLGEAKNIVYRFEKPNKFHVSTVITGSQDPVITIFTKLDTTKCYNNIFQLKKFAEYKGSQAYGQILLGEIHSMAYYESNKTPNKYLITFETTYQGEYLDKTRLIDSVIVKLKKNERIANANCRFNTEYDAEIIAIYKSEDEEKEAKIIRAFRCNRNSEAIKEIDISKVHYKEADRDRMTW
jgi:hypothetical protein